MFDSSRFVFYSNLCFEQKGNLLFEYCNLSFEKANLLCFKTQITKFKTQIYPKISKISTGSKHKFQKANLLYFDHICVLNLKFAFWNTEFPLVMMCLCFHCINGVCRGSGTMVLNMPSSGSFVKSRTTFWIWLHLILPRWSFVPWIFVTILMSLSLRGGKYQRTLQIHSTFQTTTFRIVLKTNLQNTVVSLWIALNFKPSWAKICRDISEVLPFRPIASFELRYPSTLRHWNKWRRYSVNRTHYS